MKLYYGFDSRINDFQTIDMLKVAMKNSKTYGYEIVFYGDSQSIDAVSYTHLTLPTKRIV